MRLLLITSVALATGVGGCVYVGRIDPSAGGAELLLRHAAALENENRIRQAIDFYADAARLGSPTAAMRLSEIYARGIGGTAADAVQARRWFNSARILGEPREPHATAPPSRLSLLEQAFALDRQGNMPEAVRLYLRAARSGSGLAARRLGEIYATGANGVERDYVLSLKWSNAARVLGED